MSTENLTTDAAGGGHRRLISADRVQGTPVFDQGGEKMGHIEDVLLDKVSGRVAYAIMSYGGFLGAGERYHPLPWPMLHYDAQRHGYVVPLDKERLKDAPVLGSARFADHDEANWADEVHTHFGLPGPFI